MFLSIKTITWLPTQYQICSTQCNLVEESVLRAHSPNQKQINRRDEATRNACCTSPSVDINLTQATLTLPIPVFTLWSELWSVCYDPMITSLILLTYLINGNQWNYVLSWNLICESEVAQNAPLEAGFQPKRWLKMWRICYKGFNKGCNCCYNSEVNYASCQLLSSE